MQNLRAETASNPARKIVESDFVEFFLTVRSADLELRMSCCLCEHLLSLEKEISIHQRAWQQDQTL